MLHIYILCVCISADVCMMSISLSCNILKLITYIGVVCVGVSSLVIVCCKIAKFCWGTGSMRTRRIGVDVLCRNSSFVVCSKFTKKVYMKM